MCRFPGRDWLEWGLALPLAFPAYVLAYAYTNLLDHAGPVQSGLRAAFEWGPRDYWFPEVRSLGGAGVMLALVLYPYVYLLARAAFLQQSVAAFDVARTLGYGPWRAFRKVAVPMARPSIATGIALVLRAHPAQGRPVPPDRQEISGVAGVQTHRHAGMDGQSILRGACGFRVFTAVGRVEPDDSHRRA